MTMCLGDLISAIDSLSADMQNVHVCLYRIDKTKNSVSATKFAVSLGDDLLGYVKDVQEVNQKLEEEFEDTLEYKGEDLSCKLQWTTIDSVFVRTVWDALSYAREYAEGEWVKKLFDDGEDPRVLL